MHNEIKYKIELASAVVATAGKIGKFLKEESSVAANKAYVYIQQTTAASCNCQSQTTTLQQPVMRNKTGTKKKPPRNKK